MSWRTISPACEDTFEARGGGRTALSQALRPPMRASRRATKRHSRSTHYGPVKASASVCRPNSPVRHNKEAPPAILLGDQRIRAKRYPNAWVLDGWLPLPQTTPWAMTLEHPGTNESRLDAMTFGDVGHISYVVGDAVRFKGAALDLIRSNPAPYHRVAVTTRPRDHISDALASAPHNMGVFSAPGFTPIFDQLSLTDHDAATACAPLRILENGKPLGRGARPVRAST